MSKLKTELAYYREILDGPHKDTIRAWIDDGETIQILCGGEWADYDDPFWVPKCSYRVKPKFTEGAYYKVTLKHSGVEHVVKHAAMSPDTFVDYNGIRWIQEEFSTEPEFIC